MRTFGVNRQGASDMGGEPVEKRVEWDRAAETLSLSVTKRSLLGRGPTRLEGTIGSYAVLVFYSYDEHAGHVTTYVVGMPPGPWGDHKITITKRGRLRRSAQIETGDEVFDDKYTIRLPRNASPTTSSDYSGSRAAGSRLGMAGHRHRVRLARRTPAATRLDVQTIRTACGADGSPPDSAWWAEK